MKKATKRTIFVLLGILFLGAAIWAAPRLYRAWQAERSERAKVEAELAREEELRQANIEYPFLDDTVVIKRFQGKDYYVAKERYQGEYDTQDLLYERLSKEALEAYAAEGILGEIGPGAEERRLEWHKTDSGEIEIREDNDRPLEEAEVLQVMDYEEYADYCKEWRLQQTYTDPELKYIVRSIYAAPYIISKFAGVGYEESVAVLYFVEQKTNLPAIGLKTYTIPTDQDVDTVEVVQIYSEEEYENILEFGQPYDPYPLAY